MATPDAPVARDEIAPTRAGLAWWLWVVAAAAIFALSTLGVVYSVPGSEIAAWWPAAGVSALLMLRLPARQRWLAAVLIVVVTAVANVVGGRDAATSVAFGIGNAVEPLLVAAIVIPRGRQDFRLRSVRHAIRFAAAVVVASSVLGLLVGLAVGAHGGPAWPTALHAAASHSSAILMIAPFAALPPNIMARIPWAEMIVQSAILATTITLLSADSSVSIPLTFVLIAVSAWAAYRFPIRAAYGQVLLTAIVVMFLTIGDIGPFSAPSIDPVTQTTIVVAFLLVVSGMTLFLSSASYEVRDATRTARDAVQLLSGGFLDSRVGLLVAEMRETGWRIMLSNRAAQEMLHDEVDVRGVWSGPVQARAAASFRDGEFVAIELPGERIVNILAAPVTGDPTRVAVQLADITSTLRATQAQLAAERERAAALSTRVELDRRQEDFVATTSHELRTPLTSIAGYVELLEDEQQLSAHARDWVSVIARNTARLRALVEDLLVLGRAVDGPDESERVVSMSARQLAEEVVAMLAPLAQTREVSLTIDACQGEIVGIRHELVRALENLVSNAVKFTPPAGEVHITSSTEKIERSVAGATVRMPVTRIVVADSGPGIPPQALEQVFERFYRAPDAEKESTPGTGLGLAITRELARRNGGSVELASRVGAGLSATLVIPAP